MPQHDRGNLLSRIGSTLGKVGSGFTGLLSAAGGAYAPGDLNLNQNQKIGLLSNVLGDMTYGPSGRRGARTPDYLNDIRQQEAYSRESSRRDEMLRAIPNLGLTQQESAALMAMPVDKQVEVISEILQYKHAPSASNQAPSNVREWEYFNQLTEEQQRQFLLMKRSGQTYDTGREMGLLNPLTGQPQTSIPLEIPIGQSPEEEALVSRAVGDEEVLTAEEIAKNNARIAREEAVGERDIARLDDFREDQNYFNQNIVDIDYMIQKGEEILAHPGFDMAFGFTRHALTGGTNISGGTDLTNLVQTFKDVEFAEMIGRMKEQSESGGAVGQVSEKEGERFENMLGDLRFATDEKQARANLERIVRELHRSKTLYELAMGNSYPDLSESEGIYIEGYSAALPRTGAFRGAGLTQMQQLRLERGEDLEDSELTALTDEQLEVIVSAQERLGI